MESIGQFGLPIIQNLQALTWLRGPMQAISFLGSEPFFLLFGSLLYWCIDSRLGVRVALILLLSTSLNSLLKLAFVSPRPGWVSPQVKMYTQTASFGMPSAHAQNAIAVWGEIAKYAHRNWLTGLEIALIALIGLSRIYLGVHFPADTVVGWVIGLGVLWGFNRFSGPVAKWVESLGLKQQLLVTCLTSLLLLVPSVLVLWLHGDWQMPEAWSQALQASLGSVPQPFSLETPMAIAGTWLGFVAGILWLNQQSPWHPQGNIWWRIAQYVAGMSVAIALWAGLEQISPPGITVIAYGFRYLRYAILGAWIAAGAPLLFRAMRRSRCYR